MSLSTDWSQVVDPMPSMEQSSDLFDGDILGDELIDIYNAAVVGGSDDDNLNDIPTLLEPASAPDIGSKESVPMPTIARSSDDSAADDGLGAFRPSTSFNDLTILLPPTTSNAEGTKTEQLASVVSSTSIEREAKSQTKRSNTCSDAPSAKRRATTTRKSNGSTSRKVGKTTGDQPSKCFSGKQSRNTPNPLTAGGQLAAAAPSGNKPLKHIVKPTAVASSAAAVITPRVDSKAITTEPSLTAARTEADFQSVAQVAVNNLILNVGINTESPNSPSTSKADSSSETIDTSTEHIKALTGSNWVAVCSGEASTSSTGSVNEKNSRARRQNLTADERARQNRDRNREHARNTRLRKKAYVEELKRTLAALVAQRDAADVEKRHSAQRELEQREVRFRVVEEFLKLRGRNEPNYARWSAILEDSFTFTLPITDYRDTVPGGKGQLAQKLSGVSQTIADANMFASFLQSLGRGGHNAVSFAYGCDRKEFFMDNCTAVLNWSGTSQGAVHEGASAELSLKGVLHAKFSPASNKLISVSMTFDTGLVTSQLNHVFRQLHGLDFGSDPNDAQAAASEADAILDSLQMPLIAPSSVPSNVTVVPVSAASITDGEKSVSSDEGNGEAEGNDDVMTTRRTLRARKD